MNVGRGRAFLILAIALLCGVLSFAVGVGSVLGQRAEASVLDASEFSFHPPPPLNLVSIQSVIAVLALLAILGWWTAGFGRALTILGASAVAVVTSQLLKQDVLVRPSLFELDAENSFPSGHMTVFAVVVAAAIWAVPRASAPTIAILGSVLSGIAAWQLLQYGWHRPSDVLGALALALTSYAGAAILRRRQPGRATRPRQSAAVAATNMVLMIIMTVSGLLISAGGIVLSSAAAWFHSENLLLNGAQVALVGASVLTTRLFLALRP